MTEPRQADVVSGGPALREPDPRRRRWVLPLLLVVAAAVIVLPRALEGRAVQHGPLQEACTRIAAFRSAETGRHATAARADLATVREDLRRDRTPDARAVAAYAQALLDRPAQPAPDRLDAAARACADAGVDISPLG